MNDLITPGGSSGACGTQPARLAAADAPVSRDDTAQTPVVPMALDTFGVSPILKTGALPADSAMTVAVASGPISGSGEVADTGIPMPAAPFVPLTLSHGYVRMVASAVRAELSGTGAGFTALYGNAPAPEQARLRLALVEVMSDTDMIAFIEACPDRRAAALALATSVTPPDVAIGENGPAEARLATITDWQAWPYQLVIVPGYTPTHSVEAVAGVSRVSMERLQEAAAAYREGQAPFIMVSGGNVYPAGTPYYEGVEMKQALLAMGIPEDAIIVEARARHTTTNLRNAGRFMLEHGMTKGLITPPGGGIAGSRVFDQTFYLSYPRLSSFNRRCKKELGYGVGELQRACTARVAFTPAAEVRQLSYRDPLDP